MSNFFYRFSYHHNHHNENNHHHHHYHHHHHPRESGRFSQLGRVVSRWGFVIARDGVNTKFLQTHHFPRLDWERINDQMSKKMIIVILFLQNYTSPYPNFLQVDELCACIRDFDCYSGRSSTLASSILPSIFLSLCL